MRISALTARIVLISCSVNALRLASNDEPLIADDVLLVDHLESTVFTARKKEKSTCPPQTVFNVGLPRTGTTSMSIYLSELGYNSHHIIFPQYAAVESCKHGNSTCDFYDQFGAGNPSRKVAFEDVPTFGLSCSLAQKYPKSKFVLMKRPFEDYSHSARFMLCTWVRNDCSNLKTSEHLKSQEFLYGGVFAKFCKAVQSRSDLCDGQGATLSAAKAWYETGLKEEFRNIQQQHDAEVKKCVPTKRLIEMNLGDKTNSDSVFKFLECAGHMPEFPHHHKANSF